MVEEPNQPGESALDYCNPITENIAPVQTVASRLG